MNKIQLWIIAILFAIGITMTVAQAAPKSGNTRAIKYNLQCLAEEVEDPLNICKIKDSIYPIDTYLA